MEKYENKNGNSGIKAYEIFDDSIKIMFDDDSIYLYTYESTGRSAIEIMKKLAKNGIGLTTYINQQIKDNFSERIQ